MITTIRKTISRLARKPKTLFLTDGLGALVTTFFLFVVLKIFHEYFGIPKTLLNYLSAIAACLCVYSTTCFFFLKTNWMPFIRLISFANLFYCILTIGLLIIYSPLITIIGITYFFIEIVIVFGLVYIELKVVTAIKKEKINSKEKPPPRASF